MCYYPGFTAFMKLIDVTVPLDASLPVYPGNTPFTLDAIKRIARGDRSNISTQHMRAHTGTHVDARRHYFDDAPGADALPLDMMCLPLWVVGADGAPARVLLRRN